MSTVVAMPSLRAIPSVALSTLAAGAAGIGLGVVVAPDAAAPPAAGHEPRVGLASGVARLPLPAGWQALGRRSSLPGLEEATAVRGVHADVALDIRPPEDASLLPRTMRRAVQGGLPSPTRQRVGARTAWRYEMPGAQPGTRLVALALPTTGGVVTFACAAATAEIARAGSECAAAIGAVRLRGAAALRPAPETAARIALPGTIADLDRVRRRERPRLAAAAGPAGRSAAALGLARGYAAAARRLQPLAGGSAVRLTTALGALAREHRALASASRRRVAPAARRAGAAIERGERRLAALVAAATGR